MVELGKLINEYDAIKEQFTLLKAFDDVIKSLEDKDHYSERYGRRGYRDHDYPREKEYSRYY